MRIIRIMTVEEQDFATLNHDLILEFLDRKKLSMDFYYDVVVFGYLSAVQQYFRNPPAGNIEFRAMANRSMRDAVARDCFRRNLPKRKAYTTSLDALEDDYRMSIRDRRRSVHEQVETRSLCEQAVSAARPDEAGIVCLVLLGYTIAEAARELGVPESAAYERMRSFRRRARAAIG